jgi:hypothetical protein
LNAARSSSIFDSFPFQLEEVKAPTSDTRKFDQLYLNSISAQPAATSMETLFCVGIIRRFMKFHCRSQHSKACIAMKLLSLLISKWFSCKLLLHARKSPQHHVWKWLSVVRLFYYSRMAIKNIFRLATKSS